MKKLCQTHTHNDNHQTLFWFVLLFRTSHFCKGRCWELEQTCRWCCCFCSCLRFHGDHGDHVDNDDDDHDHDHEDDDDDDDGDDDDGYDDDDDDEDKDDDDDDDADDADDDDEEDVLHIS